MEDIRLYDFQFTLLCILNDCTSANWSLKYNGVGTFEGHFPLSSRATSVALSTPYLVAVQGGKQAIITSKDASSELVLYGRTPNWILTKRVMPDFDQLTGDVGTLAHGFVTEWFADLIEDGTFVANVPPEGMFTTQVKFWRNTYHPVGEVVADVLERDNGGHRVTFDTVQKKWIYEATKGGSLPIVLSEDNLTAYDTTYSEDLLNYSTAGVYQVPQEPEEEGGETPDPVWETVVSDPSKTGIYRWECVLSAQSESEAKSELLKKQREVEAAMTAANLRYGVDYQLGDQVLLTLTKGGFSFREQKRITGVDIWYEANNVGEKPTFLQEPVSSEDEDEVQ